MLSRSSASAGRRHDAAIADPLGARARQIRVLRQWLALNKYMQLLGGAGFLVCTLSMFALFLDNAILGGLLFGIALLLLCGSLACSLLEVLMSTDAIEVEIADLEDGRTPASASDGRVEASAGVPDGRFP